MATFTRKCLYIYQFKAYRCLYIQKRLTLAECPPRKGPQFVKQRTPRTKILDQPLNAKSKCELFTHFNISVEAECPIDFDGVKMIFLTFLIRLR